MSESDRGTYAVRMENIWTRFGEEEVHRDISLCVYRGEKLGLVGGSGSGKTTLLREMIGLMRPTSGSVEILGHRLGRGDTEQSQALRNRCGVLFQGGALFSDLDVFDNIALPLRELRLLEESFIRELVCMKLRLVGLDLQVERLMPYELSGGMVKRVGLARALALEPELLFLDEPTSGLDPIAGENFVRLINRLHGELGFTMVMITHDLHSLPELCDRIAVLADGRLVAEGTLDEVIASEDPFVQRFFHGSRARRMLEGYSGERDA